MPTEEERRQDLFEFFISLGVPRDRARDLAAQLAQVEMPDFTELSGADQRSFSRDLGRYYTEWADIAKSAEYQDKIGRYLAFYNPKTGRTLDEERTEQEETQQSFSQFRTASAVENTRQRQALRRIAEGRSQFEEQLPPIRTATQISAPFIKEIRETVSPAAQRFFAREIPNLFASGGFAERRRRFLEEQREFPGLEPRSFKGITPEQERELNVEIEDFEAEQEAKRKRIDPFEQFLSTFPFRETFQALTPRERGFQSRQFRPRTRFL